MISFFKANRATNHFDETQNIIIIETDGTKKQKNKKTRAPATVFFKNNINLTFLASPPVGYSNTGKNPLAALQNIRSVLGYLNGSEEHAHETMLGTISHSFSSKKKENYMSRNKS